MHFVFALELPNADLLNIDLLDTHLYLLYTVSILISPVSILLQDMSSRPMFTGTVLWCYYGFVIDIVDPVEKASMVGKCLLRIVCFEVTSFFILFYRRY